MHLQKCGAAQGCTALEASGSVLVEFHNFLNPVDMCLHMFITMSPVTQMFLCVGCGGDVI